jgi:hypothetical protein
MKSRRLGVTVSSLKIKINGNGMEPSNIIETAWDYNGRENQISEAHTFHALPFYFRIFHTSPLLLIYFYTTDTEKGKR